MIIKILYWISVLMTVFVLLGTTVEMKKFTKKEHVNIFTRIGAFLALALISMIPVINLFFFYVCITKRNEIEKIIQ